MGIVLVTFPPTKIPYVLYPCYHMPNNPQNTLGLTPIKYYNCARVARVEALDWMHLVNKEGKSIKVRTIPHFHNKELQDYVSINIHVPSYQKSDPNNPTNITKLETPLPALTSNDISHPQKNYDHQSISHSSSADDVSHPTPDSSSTGIGPRHAYATRILAALHAPIVNVSFSKHDYVDWSLFHRRLDHIKDEKMANMCKRQLLKDLPKSFPAKFQNHRRDCWIRPRASLHNDPHGTTVNTDHLRPGQLIHLDFFFMNKESIRKFTSVLNVVDAKTRKLWLFCTPSKTPPLDIIRLFLTQLQRMGRPVSHIRTNGWRTCWICRIL